MSSDMSLFEVIQEDIMNGNLVLNCSCYLFGLTLIFFRPQVEYILWTTFFLNFIEHLYPFLLRLKGYFWYFISPLRILVFFLAGGHKYYVNHFKQNHQGSQYKLQ